MLNYRRLRSRALTVLAATAVLTGTATLGSVGSVSAAAPDVVVSGITVSDTAFTLTKLQTGTTTVTLHLSVPAGQRQSYLSGGTRLPVPAVVDDATGRPLLRTPMTLVSGTRTNGTWQAELAVGAAHDGTHALSVETCPADRACASAGPVVDALGHDVVVAGSNWPTIVDVVQSPARLDPGQTRGAVARGRVVYSDSRAPVPGVDIRLERSTGATPGPTVDTTGPKGRFSAPWPWPGDEYPRLLATTLATSAADTGLLAVHDTRRLRIPASQFRVSTDPTKALVIVDEPWSVHGVVSPGRAPVRLGPVLLERRTANGWRIVDRARLRPVLDQGQPTRRAEFTLTTSFSTDGQQTLRVRKPGAACASGSCRIRTGVSHRTVVVVGGPDYLVERRLAALGVPVGTVDGVTDARTRQALCAWRDMIGRRPTREAVTPGLARSILSARRLPRPDRSDGLYVNKTCQVLFQVVDQRYRRVVWVSTGGPGYDTPVGTGAVFRKMPGPVESTLYPEAYMYDPMFFLTSRPGIALHGSVSNTLVLPYPASHGCIRVWRPQMHEIYQETAIGTKVQVYGTY